MTVFEHPYDWALTLIVVASALMIAVAAMRHGRSPVMMLYAVMILLLMMIVFIAAPAHAESCDWWKDWSSKEAQWRDNGQTEAESQHKYLKWYYTHHTTNQQLALVLNQIHGIYVSGFLARQAPETVGHVVYNMCSDGGWDHLNDLSK